MGPPEKEDNTKKAGVPPEPLCLFCFPEDTSFVGKKTYVNPLLPDARRPTGRDDREGQGKDREEFWLKKRTEARIRRRRAKEPIRNLRTYLLTSVKNEKATPKAGLPSLFEVLETVKDAWPSPSSRNVTLHGYEDRTKQQSSQPAVQPVMKDEKLNLQFSSQLLNRRLSMPEELMRKYSVKEKTSEESETNKTAAEISPSSSSTLETARKKVTDRADSQPTKADAYQQTSDSDDGKHKKTDQPKRVMQTDYYKQGQRILKVKAVDACTCRERDSSTSASAKEETDESGTTESVPSSSPTQLPKRESSSGNLSSESDNLRCTCAELSSKETSTDLYQSGKSTLSQTVSDKSMSTQDSTVSINSVSTRGSTVSDNSNSTTPEIERTSAKETTTSPDYSPRTPRNRKNRRRDKKGFHYDSSRTCPKHSRNFLSINYERQCPVHSDNPAEQPKMKADVSTNTEDNATQTNPDGSQTEETGQPRTDETTKPPLTEPYKWAKLSSEELYMMQQLRHRRFIESQRKLSNPLPPTPDTDSITACGTGSTYAETERLDQTIMIPRYSALPRSLSMLVNTSSADTSHNSDSDSLADSLEEQPVTHVHRLYFDTKKESKPVRGDVNVQPENKQRHRQPRGRAFFVSIKEPYGEDEMLESIEKIPQPPDRIKNQIFERHLSLCTKHKQLHKTDERKEKTEVGQKKRKPAKDGEKTPRAKKNPPEESKKQERKTEKPKKSEEQKPKTETMRKKKETNNAKGRFNSKIPVLVSSPSASSSPEREPEQKQKTARPKIRVKRPKEEPDHPTKQTEMETTQILEITQTGTELSLQKPQAIIHPSQIPFEAKQEPQLTIPPLAPTLRVPNIRQNWNKQILFTQARRSPIGKFRQRFEVIPEEKSSSLSSAEEKNGRDNSNKFADASTSPQPSDTIQFHSYNVNEVPNLIVAKITNKQLETLPYVKGSDNQKIILFSSKPQNCNSSKGRDALIAMNREDFNRLAKGWMNFYKLNENMDNEEMEDKIKEEAHKQNNKQPQEKPKNENNQQKENAKQEQPELGDNVRLDCSNTILRNVKSITSLPESDRNIKKENSLPEVKLPSQTGREVHRANTLGCLPSVGKHVEDDDTDSDSTDYMEPPSPRVPPLPIDDIPSDGTLSSSDDDLKGQSKSQSLKYLQVKKRTTMSKPKGSSPGTSRFGKKKNSAWSVTVAGTVELSRSAPDLEMRLSFPANGGPPVVSQSDSGFADDSNYSKLSESLQDLDSYVSRQELSSGNLKQKWMVTVKNSKQGDKQPLNKDIPRNSNTRLPEVEPPQSRNQKKVLKDVHLDEKVKRVVERKMRAIWPKVQKVIRKEFLTESGRLITELENDFGQCLTVRGNAVSMEQKQKPPTMTERDVTRRYTSRTDKEEVTSRAGLEIGQTTAFHNPKTPNVCTTNGDSSTICRRNVKLTDFPKTDKREIRVAGGAIYKNITILSKQI